jgi:Zn-dependent protease with chaperone function
MLRRATFAPRFGVPGNTTVNNHSLQQRSRAVKNYLLMAGGLAVAILACVGIIHYEAEQTREAMRDISRNEIPRGVRDGIKDSIGPVGDGAASVGAMADKLQSTIGEVVGGRRSDGTSPSLPETAESAAKVAGGLIKDVTGAMGSPKGDGGSSDGGDKEGKGGGGLIGQLQSTIGDVIGKGSDKNSSDSSGTGGSTGRDSKTSGSSADPKSEDSTPAAEAEVEQRKDTIGTIFDMAHGTIKRGDEIGQRIFGLSPSEERDWGEKLHNQLLDEVKVVRDRALAKRIEKITKPLLSARKRRDLDFTFTVIKSEDDDINAFSIVGGYIYIHSALVKFVESDSELQFVLGHEIGHVDLGHCTQQLTYVARATELASPIAGNVVGVLQSLVTRPYTKNQEFDADAYAYKAVVSAGQSRQQPVKFLRHFAQYLKDKGHDDASEEIKDDSVVGAVASRIKDHFHTHPPIEQRISRLEAMSGGSDTKSDTKSGDAKSAAKKDSKK